MEKFGEQEQNHKSAMGAIDIVTHNRISGWAFLPMEPWRRVVVAFDAGQGEVIEAVADNYRADLEDAGRGDGHYGFTIDVPEGLFIDAEAGQIQVEIRETGDRIAFELGGGGNGSYSFGVPKSVTGDIELVENGMIVGWLAGARSEGIRPMIFVDSRPLLRIDYPLPRPDLNDALKLSGDFGFVCHVGGLSAGALIELYAVVAATKTLVARKRAKLPMIQATFINQLLIAKDISARRGAVAIACWEGGHNPIGRAKVLYDVIRTQRPALVAVYLFDEFGGRLWPPLLNTDIAVLSIPWHGREFYHRAIRETGISFETVVVCKPRYPGFELASRLAAPEAKLIVDIDDNEEHFSRSQQARLSPYGKTTINLARELLASIPARTAASATLVKDFGAFLLRHARANRVQGVVQMLPSDEQQWALDHGQGLDPTRDRDQDSATEKSRREMRKRSGRPVIGFIGTVRPHKHLLEAARAIQLFNWTSGMDATLHVYGDVQPKAYAEALIAAQAIVRQTVPMASLSERLAAMDVILTGFPGVGSADAAVTRYQISAKISDALAMGIPVLVPRSPSVEDLEELPGVLLFDDATFGSTLMKALEHREKIDLPFEFTLEGAYRAFAAAETMAEAAPRALEVFSGIVPGVKEAAIRGDVPTLLLVWKQHDSQIFGRRIDQIARAYRQACPNHRVVIVELMHDHNVKAYREHRNVFSSEYRLICERMEAKARGAVDADGVECFQLQFGIDARLASEFERFLVEERLFPDNTVVILFPIIRAFDRISEVLAGYRKIMDVVDNHTAISAGFEKQDEILAQYMSMVEVCDRVIFNSEVNREWFRACGLLPDLVSVDVVRNWYALPAGYKPSYAALPRSGPLRNVVYSGNMNRRIDWSIIQRLADMSKDIRVHLVGPVTTAGADFESLVQHPNVIYHGPLIETDTLRLLERMDVAIMAHLVDDVSNFMDPLKVHMYAAVGIPVVSTNVPGIVKGRNLTVTANSDEFLEAVRVSLIASSRKFQISLGIDAAERYIDIVLETFRVPTVGRPNAE